MKCAVHPKVETELLCATCGVPICPDCMVETPVGMKCRGCGLAPVPELYRVSSGVLARAVAAGALMGTAVGLLVIVLRPYLGLLVLLFTPLAGRLIGDASGSLAGGKRGPTIAAAVAGSCIVGMLLLGPHLLRLLAGLPMPHPRDMIAFIAARPVITVFAGLAAVFAYRRLR